MITTHLHWSSDITKAPKGEMVTTRYHEMVKGQAVERSRTEHVPTRILAVSKFGQVMVTYWVPEKLTHSGSIISHGHWSGFAERPEYDWFGFAERPEFGCGPVLWAAMPNGAELLASHAAITGVGDWSLVEEDA